MVKLHSNRAFLGNIALVVFLSLLVTLTLGLAPQQAQAAAPVYDPNLEWQGSSSGPGAAILDSDGDWQQSSAQIEVKNSKNVTFTIQVMTDDDFSNILFEILQGGETAATFTADDVTSVIYNDVYGTGYQVYQVVYDWVYSSGLDLTNNYTLGVYDSDSTLASITLDLEEPPPQGGGGGGGGGGPAVDVYLGTTAKTGTVNGILQAGGDLNYLGMPGEGASAVLIADTSAIMQQLTYSTADQVLFKVPEEVTLKSKSTPITEAVVKVPADTLDAIFAKEKPIVIDLAGVQLEMPAGAIDLSLFTDQNVNIKFSLTRLAENEIPAPGSAAYTIAGQVYVIEIGVEKNGYDRGNISDFKLPITLTLPYDADKLGDLGPETLGIYRFTDGKWQSLGGEVDSLRQTVSVTRDSLSIYTVIADANANTGGKPVITSDITGHWAEAAIKELIARNAMSGYPDGTFKPDNSISRAEFATILVKAFNLKSEGNKVFSDTASHWAREYIATAYACGIIAGYSPNTFGPDDQITREQMAAMIVRAIDLPQAPQTGVDINFSDAADISDWADSAVKSVVVHKIMSGYPDNTFKPGGNASRAEAATVIVNALKVK
jgi:hypothetical protein